jgi:aerobic carbon-monoxide dehydrogenase medium subunit
MKPPPFEYARPESVPEVLSLLAEDPEGTSLLAGGQSLVPVLNMRMAQPARVVDLNRVAGLDAIEEAGDGRVRLGAMVRQRRAERDPLVRERAPLIAEAVRYIAHPAIRTRGTVGGSLAHADPAAELPATVSVLDGRLLVRGESGERSVPAADFFVGPLTTAIEPGELLVGVEVAAPPQGSGHAFAEVARTHGAFALAAAAAVVHVGDSGVIDHAALALAGVGPAPYTPVWLSEAVLGEAPGEALFARLGTRVREEVEPFDDVHGTPDYRKRLAGVLATRVLAAAAARSNGRTAR